MLSSFRSLDRLLRGDATRMDALRSGTIDVPVPGTVVLLSVLGMVYGACMGVFSLTSSGSGQHMQIVASTVKVPVLFLATLLVTFPSLYVFNAMVGSRLRFVAVMKLMLGAMGVTMAVLASLGPIVGFFSISSTSYSFVLLLNVAVFAVSGGLGMLFLLHTLNRLTIAQHEPIVERIPTEPAMPVEGAEASGDAESPALRIDPPRIPGAIDAIEGQAIVANVKRIFRVWIVLFGIVGAQMAWVLRPFIGTPGKDFTWFRERGSSFFEAVWHAIVTLLGVNGRGGW